MILFLDRLLEVVCSTDNLSSDNNTFIFIERTFLSQLKELHIKRQSNLLIKNKILNNKSST